MSNVIKLDAWKKDNQDKVEEIQNRPIGEYIDKHKKKHLKEIIEADRRRANQKIVDRLKR